ncbi:MAG TPA: methyltransferase domain-containing protein [Chitinophagales bacterium]|nr:methyltransferase domain-containing protein [Chitinophagales bacterium]
MPKIRYHTQSVLFPEVYVLFALFWNGFYILHPPHHFLPIALMYQYRKTLYQNYFETQTGRRMEDVRLQPTAQMNHDNWLLSQEILPHLPPPAQNPVILDIGCGFGSWVYALQQKGYQQVSGIDISPAQITIARQLGIPNIYEADLIPYLQAHSHTFNLITGIDIIEHFGKDELVEVLRAVYQALKPGGKAIFRTPNADALMASLYMYGDFTHETLLNPSAARQLLLSAQFAQASVYPSCIHIQQAGKNLVRRAMWQLVTLAAKATVFASGRSVKGLIFTPNLIMVATRGAT